MVETFFYSYWWLIFPVMFFVTGLVDRWLAYQRSREQLELLRSYAAQGKDPPPELMRAINEEQDLADEGSAYGAYDRYGRHRRRMLRHHLRLRYGPYWAWRTAIVTGAVAAGFWFAAEYTDVPGIEWPFHLVAIILTCVAAGHGAVAILSTVFRSR